MRESYDELEGLSARLAELESRAADGIPVATELDEVLQALEAQHAELGRELRGEGAAAEGQ